MQSQQAKIKLHQKIQQSIEKSSTILAEKKHYEFIQKIILLAHRKIQMKKQNEAQLLLYYGTIKLIQSQDCQQNSINQLIKNLLDMYQKNRALWTEQHPKKIYELLNMKHLDRTIQYYCKIIKNICPITENPYIAQDLITFYQSKELFFQAQPHVAQLDLSRVMDFLEKWGKKVDEEQYFCIVCRMALMQIFQISRKGIICEEFDETMVLISEIPSENPFVKFTNYLIQAAQMKSREAYEKIGKFYGKFLQKDQSFKRSYDLYGSKYFQKESTGKKGGLLSLFG